MEAVRRIRRSEAGWREILARRGASDVTDVEFCRAQGIHPTMLRRWQSKLGKAKKVKSTVRAAAKAASPFIDIGAVSANRAAMEVRLDLGGGMVLSIARG